MFYIYRNKYVLQYIHGDTPSRIFFYLDLDRNSEQISSRDFRRPRAISRFIHHPAYCLDTVLLAHFYS
jgi:hypothetical protein